MSQAFKIDARVKLTPRPKVGPGVVQMAKNFTREMSHVVGEAAKGNGVVVDAGEQMRRMMLCRGCEFFNEGQTRCLHPKCGCFLRFKTWLGATKCPAEKW